MTDLVAGAPRPPVRCAPDVRGAPDVIVHAEWADDGAFTIRTEPLRTWALRHTYDRHAVGQLDPEVQRLRDQLLADIERAGRLVVGEVRTETFEDWERNWVTVVVEAMTRQSDVGEWASIWAAIREDGWV